MEIVAEVDCKIDDCKPNTGSFQFSTFVGSGGQLLYGLADGEQLPSSDDPTVIWQVKNGQPNCGAASLL